MSAETLSEHEALLERARIEAQLHDYWHEQHIEVTARAGGTKPTNHKVDVKS